MENSPFSFVSIVERIEQELKKRGESIVTFVFWPNPFVRREKNPYYISGTQRGHGVKDREAFFPIEMLETKLTWEEARVYLDYDEGAAAITCFTFQTSKAIYEFRWTPDIAPNCGAGIVRMKRTPFDILESNPLQDHFGIRSYAIT